jgi:hypothetical protein
MIGRLPEHLCMNDVNKTPSNPSSDATSQGAGGETRRPSDYWGAFCLVVLIVTVAYAVYTAN